MKGPIPHAAGQRDLRQRARTEPRTRCHVRAGANARLHVAFRQELVEGIHDDVARHAELRGKLAGGQHSGRGRQGAGEDEVTNPFVDLPRERNLGATVDGDERHWPALLQSGTIDYLKHWLSENHSPARTLERVMI